MGSTIVPDDQIQQILEELDVPENDRWGIFEVLDADAGGTLTLQALTSGIMCLRGDPRRSDVIRVLLAMKYFQGETKHSHEFAYARINLLQESMNAIMDKVELTPPVPRGLPTS